MILRLPTKGFHLAAKAFADLVPLDGSFPEALSSANNGNERGGCQGVSRQRSLGVTMTVAATGV